MLRKVSRTVAQWHSTLIQSVESQDAKKFVMDSLDLFRQDVANENPIQLEVLKNLVAKLRSGRNHHFSNTIKQIAKTHRHWLGESNYNILKVNSHYNCMYMYI